MSTVGPPSRTASPFVRVLDQAVRDGIIDRNAAHVTGWQHQFRRAEDELDNPRALALPDSPTLLRLSNALVARSTGRYQGWGDVVTFAACTGARIGEVSGCRIGDIDTDSWLWLSADRPRPHLAASPTRAPRVSALGAC